MPRIPVPIPFPAPMPGGGPQDGYQFQFNTAYYKSRRAELQPFFYGRPGAQPGEPLTGDQVIALADDLYAGGSDFDQQIEYFQWEPYVTMYMRTQVYGYQREPVGTGNTPQPPNVVTPEDLQGPPIPGKYLLASCDINDFPPARQMRK